MLTEDEKELGVALVEMGAGTTDLADLPRGKDPPPRHGRLRRQQRDERHRARPRRHAGGRRAAQGALRLRVRAARRPGRGHLSCRAPWRRATARFRASCWRTSSTSAWTRSSTLVQAEIDRRGLRRQAERAASCSPAAARRCRGSAELASDVFGTGVRVGVPAEQHRRAERLGRGAALRDGGRARPVRRRTASRSARRRAASARNLSAPGMDELARSGEDLAAGLLLTGAPEVVVARPEAPEPRRRGGRARPAAQWSASRSCSGARPCG